MSGEAEHSFGAILRRFRQSAGLTQEELAERAHLSVRGINDLERGVRRLPRKDTVALLVEALALGPVERAAFEVAAHRQSSVAAASADDARATRPAAEGGNLPLTLTSFVGRQRELAAVRCLLAESRLVTLTGAGGCGKTRLALEVAARVQRSYTDGVWLVELAALSDPALVPQAVAGVLRVREQRNQPLLTTLASFLRPKHLLLLLDNCEHLVAACAELADVVLRTCPQITILATSREPVGVPGERAWRVPSLALPEPGTSPASVQTSEAVCLFLQRAEVARPRFAPTLEQAGLVAHICRRLDGMPLAIELAAARLASLPLEHLAARLDDRFRLLTGGSRTALPRQQTLRAALDWSYELLSESEQVLLRRLSVFAGGWTLEAAEAVCSNEGLVTEEVLDLLAGLVHRSLVNLEDEGTGDRYQVLETVRQYGQERLLASGEEAPVRDRHLDWFLALAVQAEAGLEGRRQDVWLDRLERERENLRAALAWSSEGAARLEKGLQLTASIDAWWSMRGRIGEGRRWLEALLARGEQATPAVRARAFASLGGLSLSQGAYRQALAATEAAYALFTEGGEQRFAAGALLGQGSIAAYLGDFTRATSLHEEVLARARILGDRRLEGWALCHLGAIQHLLGNYVPATALFTQSLALHKDVGDSFGVGNQIANLANVARDLGEYERAARLQRESLEVRIALRDMAGFAECFEGLGVAAAGIGQPERATRLLAAAEAMREAIGRPVELADRVAHERMMATLPALLGAEAFAALWAEGRALPLDAAIAYAMENVP